MKKSDYWDLKRIELEENLKLLARFERELQPEIELAVYDRFVMARRLHEKRRKDYKKKLEGIYRRDEREKIKAEQDMKTIKSTLSKKSKISMEYKINTCYDEMMSRCCHAPAYIVVLNFDPRNKKHQGRIFVSNREKSYGRYCIGESILDPKIFEDFEKIGYEDNAVLVKKDGIIHAANVLLVNVSAAEIPAVASANANKEKEIYEILGFTTDVHARNLAAIGASYHLYDPENPVNPVVYVLSEYLGIIRRFKNGNNTFSSLCKENKIARQKLESFYIN